MPDYIKLIKKLKMKSFSNDDIKKLVDTKIIIYNELSKYKHIDDALHPNGTLVILYMYKESYGHWTCLIKRDENTIEHFDSYPNMKPDDELSFIDNEFRKEHNEWYPYLTKLLYDSGYNIEYNDQKLQEKHSDIRTCGRWVVARIFYKDVSIDDFIKFFTSNSKYSPDDMVTVFTEYLRNKK